MVSLHLICLLFVRFCWLFNFRGLPWIEWMLFGSLTSASVFFSYYKNIWMNFDIHKRCPFLVKKDSPVKYNILFPNRLMCRTVVDPRLPGFHHKWFHHRTPKNSDLTKKTQQLLCRELEWKSQATTNEMWLFAHRLILHCKTNASQSTSVHTKEKSRIEH